MNNQLPDRIVVVACPECGVSSRVRSTKLPRSMHCLECDHHFWLDAHGRSQRQELFEVAVKSSLAKDRARQPLWSRLRQAWIVLLAVASGMAGTGLMLILRKP